MLWFHLFVLLMVSFYWEPGDGASSKGMYLPFTPTGIVQEYTLVITRETPADKSRPLVLINGTSPGPTLYVTLGDTLRVTVINELYDDATGVHWHGMSMDDEPWMDGVIDLTQCPISNVQGFNEFVYEFTPDSAGTFWYHGHYHSQYPDGLYGALIVTPSDEELALHAQFGVEYVFDREEEVYTIADYYLEEVRRMTDVFLSPQPVHITGRDPVADAFTVNGAFSTEDDLRFNPLVYNGSNTNNSNSNNNNNTHTSGGGRERVKVFTQNPNTHRARWRFINAAAFGTFRVSIDDAVLEIIEIDGIPVQPLFVGNVTLSVAQRVSFIPHFLAFSAHNHINSSSSAGPSYLRITHLAEYYPTFDASRPHDNLQGYASKQPLNYHWTERLVFAFTENEGNTHTADTGVSQLNYSVISPLSDNLWEAEPLVYHAHNRSDGGSTAEEVWASAQPTHVLVLKSQFYYQPTSADGRIGYVQATLNDEAYPMRMAIPHNTHANTDTLITEGASYVPLSPQTPLLFEFMDNASQAEHSPSLKGPLSPLSLKTRPQTHAHMHARTYRRPLTHTQRHLTTIHTNTLDSLAQTYALPYNASSHPAVLFLNGSGAHPYALPGGGVVDIIIDGECCGSHPFHLHGHHFYLMDSSDFHTHTPPPDHTPPDNAYYYYYHYSDPSDVNTTVPPAPQTHTQSVQGFKRSSKPIRDVALIPPGGWIRIRIIADNPGVWMFHCHLHWHMEMGLSVLFVEDAPNIQRKYSSSGGRALPLAHSAMCDAPTAVNYRLFPTESPTNSPISPPSLSPSALLTLSPSYAPTNPPSVFPSVSPSLVPSHTPTPTHVPTHSPTQHTSLSPTQHTPTLAPTPTATPTQGPSTVAPSLTPTVPNSHPLSTPSLSRTLTQSLTGADTDSQSSPLLTLSISVRGLRERDFAQAGVCEALLLSLVDTLPLLRVTMLGAHNALSQAPTLMPTQALTQLLDPSTQGRHRTRRALTQDADSENVPSDDALALAEDAHTSSSTLIHPHIRRRHAPHTLTTRRTQLQSQGVPHTNVSVLAEPLALFTESYSQDLLTAMQFLLTESVRTNNLTRSFRSYIVNIYENTSTIYTVLDEISIEDGRALSVVYSALSPTFTPTQSPTLPRAQLPTQSPTEGEGVSAERERERGPTRVSTLFYEHLAVSLSLVILLGLSLCVSAVCFSQYLYHQYTQHKEKKERERDSLSMAAQDSDTNTNCEKYSSRVWAQHTHHDIAYETSNESVNTTELILQTEMAVAQTQSLRERSRFYLAEKKNPREQSFAVELNAVDSAAPLPVDQHVIRDNNEEEGDSDMRACELQYEAEEDIESKKEEV